MIYDIAVVGGGPAGLSAAVQGRTRGKSVVVVSTDIRDNALYKAHQVDNYLGFPRTQGAQLLTQFRSHAETMGVQWKAGRVLNILPTGAEFFLGVGSDMVQARSVVLTTGTVQAAKLPGEQELLGRGVSYCATCDGMFYRGRRVAVLGWTPSAKKEAAYLESIGCQVLYLDKPRDCAIQGGEKVEALVHDGATEAVEGVFLLRPAVVPGELFPGLAMENGFVAVDRNMAASLPGVFAAGDCTGKPFQVSKAVGEGLIAGQSASSFLERL